MKQPDGISVDRDVRELFSGLKVPQRLCGYEYLVLAVQLTLDNPDITVNEFLTRIAQVCGTQPTNVESAMCKAITDSWTQKENIPLRASIFGNIVQFSRGKPSLREYVTQIAGYIRMKRSGWLT